MLHLELFILKYTSAQDSLKFINRLSFIPQVEFKQNEKMQLNSSDLECKKVGYKVQYNV